MTRDCKDIHQIIRAQDSWQDGWKRAAIGSWEIALTVALVIVIFGIAS